jgi:TnpA family transposase
MPAHTHAAGVPRCDPELPIEEHTTDTAGYTELICALFDLLGMQFSPRIRDMADQQLYRADRRVRYEHIEPLFSGTINNDLILDRWDDLVRLAASLKMGWATASLLLSKLQSPRRQNALLPALQEYGRLIKTIHIVRCLDSPEYRKRIGIQLNKGESLHDLRRFLFFANEGDMRRVQHEDQTVQALCLNLVTNAVITWNTVYMTKALDALRADDISVRDEDLAHLAPTLRAHINPYGKYSFDVESGLARSGFRPLREPSAAASA